MVDRHLLFIAHRVPYPPNKGEKIRSFNELKHLAAAGWQIHLCALADDPEDLGHSNMLKQWCRTVFVSPISRELQKWKSLSGPFFGLPLSAPYFYSTSLQRRVDTILNRYPIDVILCFSGPMAEYVFRSKCRRLLEGLGSEAARRLNGQASRTVPEAPQLSRPAAQPSSCSAQRPRLIMDLVDIDSDKWSQYSRWANWPMSWVYRLESNLLARYERRAAERFDATLLVSPAEAGAFRDRSGAGDKVYAVGNGVDLDYFHPPDGSRQPSAVSRQFEAAGSNMVDPPNPPASEPSSDQPRTARLVFCGAMDYYPNADAVKWFVREVLPLIRAEIGGVDFTIVGSNPGDGVRKLASDPLITVTGRVPDVRPFVWNADVSVAPIRVARGIQNKVLEAMAMGKPVVATPEAFEGIEAEAGVDLQVVPAVPRDFSKAVVALLKDGRRAAKLGERGRELVANKYRWEAPMLELERILGKGPVEDGLETPGIA